MEPETTRNRIMLAAGPIFARKGFRATTVREISQAADVNLASINYYFGDKETLYSETLMLAREMRAQQFPQPELDTEIAAAERLHKIVLTMLNRVMALQSEPWQVRLIMREIVQPSEAFRPLVKAYFLPFFETLLQIVDELVGARLPDYQRNQIGFSIIGQCMHYRFSSELVSMMVPRDEFDSHCQIGQLADHITQFSLAAIHQLSSRVSSEAAS